MVAVLDHPRLAKPDTTAMAAPDTAPIPRPIPRRYRALWVRLWRFDCGGFDCGGSTVEGSTARARVSVPHPRQQGHVRCRADTVPFGLDCGGSTAEDLTATAWIFWSNCSSISQQRGAFHTSPTRVNLYSSEPTKLTHLAGNGAWALSTRVCVFPDVEALRQYYRNHDVLSAKLWAGPPDPRGCGVAIVVGESRASLPAPSYGHWPKRPRAPGSMTVHGQCRRSYALLLF